MATSMPFPFQAQVPVTPPPDQHVFFKGPFAPLPARSDFPRAAYSATGMRPPQGQTPTPSQPALNIPPTGVPSAGGPAAPGPNVPEAATFQSILQDPSVDPRYLAMASRIASYYQQRCQAISNYQQQRCQVWANAQRQKCQEMTQAAMLIVAWYIRDRITRRRRRQRRQFRRGLKQKASSNDRNRITKGEAVRRWVLSVPADATASPKAEDGTSDGGKRMLDKEEMDFEMGRDTSLTDKDAHLFSVADNLIKSQLTRIDVPLLGALSFDESDDSDSESEEDDEVLDEEVEEELDDNFEQQDADGELEKEWEGEVDVEEAERVGETAQELETAEVAGSKSVHPGSSTRRSRKRTRSSCSS